VADRHHGRRGASQDDRSGFQQWAYGQFSGHEERVAASSFRLVQAVTQLPDTQ
jgi:hypothetical protein